MNKQLITLVGALVSIGIVLLAVVLGVLPLIAGASNAFDQAGQAAAMNTTYQAQVDHLTSEQQRIDEIDASVAALRRQIPGSPLLDQAFEIIAVSARGADVGITSVTRGDLSAFAPRPAPVRAGPGADEAAQTAAQPAPAPTPTPGSGNPVEQAAGTADAANDATAQTNAANGVTAPAPDPSTAATAAPASDRLQIPLSVSATAPDMASVRRFLDGLRSSQRLLAVDTVTVTESGGFEVQVEMLAFLTAEGGAK